MWLDKYYRGTVILGLTKARNGSTAKDIDCIVQFMCINELNSMIYSCVLMRWILWSTKTYRDDFYLMSNIMVTKDTIKKWMQNDLLNYN